jgi:DNA-binding MarR family transcriptional regulator
LHEVTVQIPTFFANETIAGVDETRVLSQGLGSMVGMDIRSGTPPPRPNSRRNNPRPYLLERVSLRESLERHAQSTSGTVWGMTDAWRTGSALRLGLKKCGLDPKLSRLVLLFYGGRQYRVCDIAWMLNVSPSTASRWLDRAERDGLVDKLYDLVDRRGTAARLTYRGVELRQAVEDVLFSLPSYDRPRGVAYGGRQFPTWADVER